MTRCILFGATALVISMIGSQPLCAQSLGPAQVFTIKLQNKSNYFRDPIVLEDMALCIGTPQKTGKDHSQRVVLTLPFDGSGQHTEKLLAAPSLPNERRINTFFTFGGRPCIIAQSWDKETGVVDIYVQTYDKALSPEDAPVKIGSVPLDPRSYSGSPLGVRPIVSPDGTKLLLYFDGIKANNIKLAMCWVVDASFDPIWNGSYRLPVLAYGATTTTHFFDNGSLSVAVDAVVLNEGNTKETSDGSLAGKVDARYQKNTTTTLYVLHGEIFARVDAEAIGHDRMLAGQLLHSTSGWSFAAIVSNGKGKSKKEERVYGTLDSDGVSVTNRVPITMEHSAGVLLDAAGAFYVHHVGKDDELTVTKLDASGQELWQHVAPYGRFPNFKLVNGRLVDYFKASRTSLSNLLDGKAARGDSNVSVMLPIVAIWYEGQRTILNIVPETASYKESYIVLPESSISEAGLLFKTWKQRSPSLTFVPFIW